MTATVHSEDALVLRQDEAGVATLTLNRPKQYNALSQAMLAALEGTPTAQRMLQRFVAGLAA